MARDIHGLPITTSSAEAGVGLRPHGLGLSQVSRRHARPSGADPLGRSGVRPRPLPEGLFRHAVLQAGECAGRCGGRADGARADHQGDRPRARACRRAGGVDRRRPRPRARDLGRHPRRRIRPTSLAFRLAHFNNFWLGRPQDMRASVERVLPKWSRELAGYGTILSCRSFAHEECGDHATAEPAGRAAVEIDPGDVWGTHAVAHVMEMQGRHSEGIAWLAALEPHWAGGSNLLHHLWWHRALFHLEQREFDAALDLYDRHFRDLAVAAHQGTARPLHRRAERRLDAVPPGAPRRRCRRALERARRQGRDADRRLPLRLHAAALDDGACRDRPRRGGANGCSRRCAPFGRVNATVARIVGRVAVPDLRSGAGASPRRARAAPSP